MNTIIVNAVGAITGGGESILRQCLNAVASEEKARFYKWIFFVSKGLDIKLEANHIRLERIEARSRFDKFLWYLFLLNKHIKESGFSPKVFVNLMNYGVRGIKLPQVIYIQQSLPFESSKNFKWFEWKARFYALAIGKWMRWSIRNNQTVVVQTDWMREAVSRKFRIDNHSIHIVRPRIDQLSETPSKRFNWPSYRLFYPAVPKISYKNHEVLINTLRMAKMNDSQTFRKVKIIFTCKPEDNMLTKSYYRLSMKLGVSDQIVWKGYLNKDELAEEYAKSDIILFPSKLETFGLPLLEAASLGKPILVLNKPYAHDVLEGYEGVKYVEDNPNEWYKTILDHYISETYCFKPFSRNNLNDWSKLVDLVISKSKGENIQ